MTPHSVRSSDPEKCTRQGFNKLWGRFRLLCSLFPGHVAFLPPPVLLMHLISQRLLLAGGLCASWWGHDRRQNYSPDILPSLVSESELPRGASGAAGSGPPLEVAGGSRRTRGVPPAPDSAFLRLCSRRSGSPELSPPAPRATPPLPNPALGDLHFRGLPSHCAPNPATPRAGSGEL